MVPAADFLCRLENRSWKCWRMHGESSHASHGPIRSVNGTWPAKNIARADGYWAIYSTYHARTCRIAKSVVIRHIFGSQNCIKKILWRPSLRPELRQGSLQHPIPPSWRGREGEGEGKGGRKRVKRGVGKGEEGGEEVGRNKGGEKKEREKRR